jgi:CRP/FNR family transcriptional regulator
MIPVQLQSLGVVKHVPVGTLLFRANTPAQGFFYIEEGRIRLYKMDGQGREVDVGTMGAGDFLGEVILFATEKYPVYAQAETDTTVLFFSKETVRTAIRNQPVIAEFFVGLMAKKCFMLNQKLESVTMLNVRQRLIKYLLSLCPGDNSCTITLPLKKTQLAQQLGTIPETLSRTFAQLEKEKKIKMIGKSIKIILCTELKTELT